MPNQAMAPAPATNAAASHVEGLRNHGGFGGFVVVTGPARGSVASAAAYAVLLIVGRAGGQLEQGSVCVGGQRMAKW
jgi:hypothetical protein